MNSEAQREALAILAEVWALSPDVRLGQLLGGKKRGNKGVRTL